MGWIKGLCPLSLVLNQIPLHSSFKGFTSCFSPPCVYLFPRSISQFPLANKMYLKTSPSLGGTAGLLYGADLMGGWLAGILAGVVLLPFFGLGKTSLLLAMLKMTSLFIVILILWDKE